MSEHRCLSCEDWQRRDAANKAEITRLREAIKRLVTAADLLEENATNPADWAEYHAAVDAQREIAREGR